MQSIGLWGSFLIGITFALGWTPCIGPVLAGILTLAAEAKRSCAAWVCWLCTRLGWGFHS